MIDYKIIKHCYRCKKRFVVHKGQAKKNYCDDCTEEYNKNKEV